MTYQYFAQPQVDAINDSVIGYELLLRQKQSGQWLTPTATTGITVDDQARLIEQAAQQLQLKVGSLSFNVNEPQFLDRRIAQAIIQAQHTIYPINLVLEVTEEPTVHPVTERQLSEQIHYFDDHGIQLSLDDVGTGRNTYEHLEPLLSAVSELKFPLQNFREAHREAEILPALQFWMKTAQQYRLRFILEGVETQADHNFANQLGIPNRQGWYYGKPHPLPDTVLRKER
ncbi:C-di-GMP-specific phosphodiesterase [Levilactobacillus senmaizukei DSM 21775 = NBRC 103853]|uniref:C-di-GMP-specific phosphodiesterase n=1 Tax=Levilactobacillus senmaizukei DSM 21775 = NBRC 103853 TaxID=1423803 RepID=A0A0R2DES4_9LACO|nr:EAL domain-containing protein [Levilactobacillus senmaizukei]KRN01779.1 C-di-GMP-specific phosphodiesterase [Levilactobacillus senmaizukei DSM 21775 = NBRC 103853]